MNVDRYFGPKMKPLGNLSKPVKKLCKNHLDWIRDQPCIVTGRTGKKVIAHHVQRRSHGTNDYLTVPMVQEEHHRMHAQGLDYYARVKAIDFKDALIAKLVERVIDLEVCLAQQKQGLGTDADPFHEYVFEEHDEEEPKEEQEPPEPPKSAKKPRARKRKTQKDK